MICFEYQTIMIITHQGGFMKTKEIKQLIEILEASQLCELSYKEADFEISIKKGGPVMVQTPQIITETLKEEKQVSSVKSPLVGVYYDKPSPDADKFVKVGDSIKVGDVLCIIEAMKVMNEIKSDQSGIVQSLPLKDGDAISYNQDILVFE